MFDQPNRRRLTLLLLFSIIVSLSAICQAQGRQRNMIYVLDCTASMGGVNGTPDIWQPTKNFLKTELEKEAKENPTSRVTILPFQEKVLPPINVHLDNIAWSSIENTLDNYLKKITATNICDSWLEAEKHIDQSCNNYIVLMTDGHDNIGGSSNEANRRAKLVEIINAFCGKYQNTKAFYVQLTAAASLPEEQLKVIDCCKDIIVIDGTKGIPPFGTPTKDVIDINTRDLPIDITVGFSGSGTFQADLMYDDKNPYVNFSIKDNTISQGKFILHVESKFGKDTEALNKAIDAPQANVRFDLHSDEVIIANPSIEVVLHPIPLRCLSITSDDAKIERIKPFLWIKGNPSDTLRWNLHPVFNEEAVSDNSFAQFKLHSDSDLSAYTIHYNGEDLSADSLITVRPNQKGVIEIITLNQTKDNDLQLILTEIHAEHLDRLNGEWPEHQQIALKGEITTKVSLIEIIFWCICGLIILFLVAWFGFIRSQIYPKFQKGIIQIQNPYFATIRVRGYRMIVFSPQAKSQNIWDKTWKGKILYHTNPTWTSVVEVSPSGKNMRFRSLSNTLVCSPQPLLMKGSAYTITDTSNPNSTIIININ